MDEVDRLVLEAEGRERLLAVALAAVLHERCEEGSGAGVIIGVDDEHFMFFTDGRQLHMTTVSKDDPMLTNVEREIVVH